MQNLTLKIRNQLASLGEIMPTVEAFLREHSVEVRASYAVRLTLEEIISNTIKYAYEGDDIREIDVALAVNSLAVVIRVEDDGNEFNPCDAPQPDTSLPIDRREVGGLGIYLVREMSESMEYQRKNGRNILEIQISRDIE